MVNNKFIGNVFYFDKYSCFIFVVKLVIVVIVGLIGGDDDFDCIDCKGCLNFFLNFIV